MTDCPFGEDCDLTLAYMMGAEKAKDTIKALRADRERLEAENAKMRGDLQHADITISLLNSGAELQAVLSENAKMRTALRLIAEHPVEQSGQWEVGAREMLKLARTTLENPHDR